jgi:prepilin-type N-terminal cleavage/methylation domain-containing protein
MTCMKPVSAHQTRRPAQPAGERGFTLIEMLVVISVIAILASMIFPITGAVNRKKIKSRVRAELEQVSTVIDTYKDKLGHYPPDNTNAAFPSHLYYELAGTTLGKNDTVYTTLDGTSEIRTNVLTSVFGLNPSGQPNVPGFINSARGTGGDEGTTVVNFLKAGLQANQIGLVSVNPPVKALVCSVPWPAGLVTLPAPGFATGSQTQGAFPCWRYNSTQPRYNTTTYDLWVDVIIAGKTNRFCNWSRDPLVVGSRTYP